MQKYNTDDWYSCRAHETNAMSAMAQLSEFATPRQWWNIIKYTALLAGVFWLLFFLNNLEITASFAATFSEVLTTIATTLALGLFSVAIVVFMAIRAARKDAVVQKIKAAYPEGMDVLRAAKAVTGACDSCEHEHAGQHVYLKPAAFDFTREALIQYAEENEGRDATYFQLQKILN